MTDETVIVRFPGSPGDITCRAVIRLFKQKPYNIRITKAKREYAQSYSVVKWLEEPPDNFSGNG